MNAIIIHGAYGNPGENWFPWLKEELEKLGIEVFVPRFPTPAGQNLDNWMKIFSDYEKHLGEDTILIGHSLGPSFILALLEKHKAKAAFLVAGFTGLLGRDEFDSINRTFVERDFGWEQIRSNCKRFIVINSDNEPYVPQKKGRELAEKLGTELIVLKGARHINKESGFVQFPLLLDRIKRVF